MKQRAVTRARRLCHRCTGITIVCPGWLQRQDFRVDFSIPGNTGRVAHLRGVTAAPVNRSRVALRQVLQDLNAKDVEELAAEEDAWLLAFFQGAPPDSLFAAGNSVSVCLTMYMIREASTSSCLVKTHVSQQAQVPASCAASRSKQPRSIASACAREETWLPERIPCTHCSSKVCTSLTSLRGDAWDLSDTLACRW